MRLAAGWEGAWVRRGEWGGVGGGGGGVGDAALETGGLLTPGEEREGRMQWSGASFDYSEAIIVGIPSIFRPIKTCCYLG